MALVSYSDSESDGEAGPSLPPPSKSSSLSLPAPKQSSSSSSTLSLPPPKQPLSSSTAPSSSSSSSLALPPPKRRKLVSDSDATGGPRKIIVDLPKSSTATEDDDGASGGSKSVFRKGGGGKGMLSFLPAPKRTGDAAAAIAKASDKGAAPITQTTANGNEGEEPKKKRMLGGAGAGAIQYAGTDMQPTVEDEEDEESRAPKSISSPAAVAVTAVSAKPAPPVAGMKPRTIQPFFRKSAKAKAPVKSTASTAGSSGPTVKETKKVSLFSMASVDESSFRVEATSSAAKEYEPIMLVQEENHDAEPNEFAAEPEQYGVAHQPPVPVAGPETLESIGQDLGLDDATMRMLQGRRGKNAPVRITEFNVEKEYNANEAKRLAGELVPEANPVRSIAPGKHQLTSLLTAAQSQKSALEEHFTQTKRSKKEAGAKYGW